MDFWAYGEAEPWMHEWVLSPLEEFELSEVLRATWRGEYLGRRDKRRVFGDFFQCSEESENGNLEVSKAIGRGRPGRRR